ncbi:FAD-dependent oxidoreductase [Jannaschia marina]|uniref:FAD-dependent oxidoreductase n=1 Tax=Jannaschia marina TaxID=2741674 RepID=UPI0015CBC388|nr:FAD-dependent oxidoreductase [Jannaschia marina]
MPTLDIALADIPEATPFQPEGWDVLLLRFGEEVSALAPTCPHFGLPLAKGVVRDGTLICPFHHACFDARTGAQSQPPGHGDLRRFEAVVRDGRVQVEVTDGPDHVATAHARQGIDARRFVIAGSGAAADACAHALREGGFEGAIEMISPSGPPLDRTMLSKAVLAGEKSPDDLVLSDAEALADLDVTVIDGTVAGVEPGHVTLTEGGRHAWDGLLLAPGGVPIRPDWPGAGLAGVHVLRSGAEAAALSAAAETARRVVFVGGGFIGMEGALSLAKRGLDVTVVLREEVPLAHVFGKDIGGAIRTEHEEAGVRFVAGAEVKGIAGDAHAEGVALADGSTVPADLVVLALGVRPATASITGLPLAEDGSVATGADLSVPGHPGLYVAGDCATAPTPFGTARIEHWRVALQHGRAVARAFLGADGSSDIPFFWTALGRQYRYLGHAEDWDEIRLDGDPSGAFLAHVVKDGEIRAAITAGRDADLAELHLRMKAAGGPIPA